MTSLLILLGAGLAGWLLARRVPLPLGLDDKLSARTEGWKLARDPKVSVLIPVRNEAKKIEACIRSVLAQDYSAEEIVVVDDGSTDATPEILERLQREPSAGALRVLRVDQTADGWTGKNWAMQMGARELSGEWILQIDGDVELAPDALRRSLVLVQREALDMLSLLSTLLAETLVERLFQLQIPMFALLFNNLDAVNDPTSPKMFVNGQFILYRAESFQTLGGYPAIASEVADDIALGRLFQRNGLAYRILFGQEYVRTRMYEDLRGIWRGWSKFLYNGLFLTPANVALCVGRILGIFVVPPVLMLISLGLALSGGASALLVWMLAGSSLVSSFVYKAWRILCISLRAERAVSVAYPVSALFFLALLVHSSYRIATRRGVVWKGRTYFSAEGVAK